ncbi:MAG: response regulator transcription factor [Saprospiraceae bacterium]|nr:response regulator transcription factor [Saprospiraceae bacterium]
MSEGKVLLLEDDKQLGSLLADFLTCEGFDCHWLQNGAQGLEVLKEKTFDVAIVDIMMPVMDGFTFATKLRERELKIPLLFCTARSLKHDKMQGFSLGADDYIVKPFDEDELVCRIRAILRRASHEPAVSGPVALGQYLYDSNRHTLTLGENTKRLTKKENKILALLFRRQGQVVPREEALVEVYGKNDYFLGRSFDVFISKLRKLLRDDPHLEIENVFGVGFILHIRSHQEQESEA